VVGVAALLGRERLDAVRLVAVAAVIAGVALVGGVAELLDAIGIVLALGAAAAYAIYIIGSDLLLRGGTDPIAFTALMTAGAATSFLVLGGVHGTLLDRRDAAVGGHGHHRVARDPFEDSLGDVRRDEAALPHEEEVHRASVGGLPGAVQEDHPVEPWHIDALGEAADVGEKLG